MGTGDWGDGEMGRWGDGGNNLTTSSTPPTSLPPHLPTSSAFCLLPFTDLIVS